MYVVVLAWEDLSGSCGGAWIGVEMGRHFEWKGVSEREREWRKWRWIFELKKSRQLCFLLYFFCFESYGL